MSQSDLAENRCSKREARERAPDHLVPVVCWPEPLQDLQLYNPLPDRWERPGTSDVTTNQFDVTALFAAITA